MPTAKKVETQEDAAEFIKNEDKTAVFMQFGAGWLTGSGVKFTKDEPYQLVPWSEANDLFINTGGRFRQASPDEIQSFYKK